MARHTKLCVSGINIRIVDSTKRDYISLFQTLFDLRSAVKVYGTQHLLMTNFSRATISPRIEYAGIIGKFVDIPDDAEWLDTNTLKSAENEQLEEIVIPHNLKPNFESFRFALFPRDHVIAFEVYSDSKSLSARLVQKWLSQICLNPIIVHQFGEINIDLIPDYDLLDKILESESLKFIAMDIRMPNPDGLDHEKYEEIAAKLDALNAQEKILSYKARAGQSLELDDDTKVTAKVAAENGKVTAKIQEDGLIRPFSTDQHPLEERDTYDPEDYPSEPIFRRLAVQLWRAVLQNRNRPTEQAE